ILFLGLCFFGGSGLIVYFLFWLLLPKKPLPKPQFLSSTWSEEFSAQEQQPSSHASYDEPEHLHSSARPDSRMKNRREARRAFHQQRGSWLGRMLKRGVLGLGLLALFIGVYAPLLLTLGIVTVSSVACIFYPGIDLYPGGNNVFWGHFSLNQFGLPGILGGSMLALLGFSLLMLVLSFIAKVHFKKPMMGSNLTSIFVAFVVMSFFTTLVCAGVISQNYKERAQLTKVKTFPVTLKNSALNLKTDFLTPMITSGFGIQSVSIQSRKNVDNIRLKMVLSARARTAMAAQEWLEDLKLRWQNANVLHFPSIQQPSTAQPRFAWVKVLITVPAHIRVQVATRGLRISIDGDFAHPLQLRNKRGRLSLNKVSTPKLTIQTHRSQVSVSEVRTAEANVDSARGFVRLRKLHANSLGLSVKRATLRMQDVDVQQSRVHTFRSSVSGYGLRMPLNLRNRRGKVRLQLSDLRGENHLVNSERGAISLELPDDQIPRVQRKEVWDNRGTIFSSLASLSKTSRVLSVHIRQGMLKLRAWDAPPQEQHANKSKLRATSQPTSIRSAKSKLHATSRPTSTRSAQKKVVRSGQNHESSIPNKNKQAPATRRPVPYPSLEGVERGVQRPVAQ
ncbi:MAG: DUF4097 family beta strand repeat-containing protein, partial [Myxococcota bacterium]